MIKTENLRTLKRDEISEASFSYSKTESKEQAKVCLKETERLSLAKLVASVITNEERVEEPIVTPIVK